MSEYTKNLSKIASVVIPLILLVISHCAHSKAISDLTLRVATLENPDMVQQASTLIGEVTDAIRPKTPKGANGPKEPRGSAKKK